MENSTDKPWRAWATIVLSDGKKGCEAMIINSSNVSMSSDRSYAGYASSKTESITVRADSDEAAMITISEESKGKLEQLKNAKKDMQEAEVAQQKENLQKQLKQMREQYAQKTRKAQRTPLTTAKSAKEIQLETLKRILEMLNSRRLGKKHGESKQDIDKELKSFERQSNSYKLSMQSSFSMSAMASATVSVGQGSQAVAPTAGVNTWVTHTVTSSFVAEVENTCFSTTGIAKTADGREISFNVELEMSRAFCLESESYVQTMQTLVDPLVINVGSNVTSVSDQKFMFDLDADGREEEISYLGEGSGFLALDKNGDGTINDGRELFGTKSGDGFKDLAAYDEDGNGWIDEADNVFKKLKIWAKNEDGTDTLISIKEAGVGAIYLGNVDTEFSLKNEENGATNAVIQKSGVFLYENGGAGTIQHIDLAL